MSGLFGMLELGRRALLAHRNAMNVTSNNIANAATPGYSRQQANLVSTMPLQNAQGFFLGTGVTVDAVYRLRDRFIDVQYRQTQGSLGSAGLKQNVLQQVEGAFNEPSDAGLQAVMARFFNSFQELATHPEEPGPRNTVIRQATALAQTFNRLNADLTRQQQNLAQDVSSRVSRINELTRSIADLNTQIGSARSAGHQPSELLDQRDMLIDQLSRLANITASQDSQGNMLVSIGGMMVAGNGASTPIQATMNGGVLRVTSVGGQDVQVTGGELGGILEMHNTVIPSQLSQLDTMTNALVTRMNAVHSAGFGLGNPPPTGVALFTGTTAATISLSAQVQSDPNLLAASADGSPGNNQNALDLFGVSTERLLDGNTTTLSQYYSRIVSTLGTTVTTVSGTARGAEMVLAQLTAQRESVSGVSLDEEMTNMIRFQRSYEAAARVISTTNELFQTILNMV